MAREVTHGIAVEAEVFFRDDHSQPLSDQFLWAYRITIHNGSDSQVKLLSRFWEIRESLAAPRTVAGDGVIGEQPELMPGETHSYISGCQLSSPFGTMAGFYLFEDLATGVRFQVSIPLFRLQLPYLLN
jgi:ApaG protein